MNEVETLVVFGVVGTAVYVGATALSVMAGMLMRDRIKSNREEREAGTTEKKRFYG